MNFRVEKISFDKWNGPMSGLAHEIIFGEKRNPSLNSFDYVLGLFDDKDEISAYVTIIEMDKESAYMQHGGVFPNYEKSIHVLNGYSRFVFWIKEHYKRANTKIENNNHRMLKLAWALGFEVTGVSHFNSKIFLELTNEFGG